MAVNNSFAPKKSAAAAKIKSPIGLVGPDEFYRVADGVYALGVPFFNGEYLTTVTLVTGGTRETTAIVDGGDIAEQIDECVVPALGKLGLSPSDVGYALFTHNHGDHVGGLARSVELSGAECVGPIELPRSGMDVRVFGEDELLCGRLAPIRMPGHSPDSTCWLDRRTGTLISGDSFQAVGTYGCGLALMTDTAAYARSIQRARGLNATAIVAGHAFMPFDTVIRGANIGAFFDTSARTAKKYIDYIAALPTDEAKDEQLVTERLIELMGYRTDKYICTGDSTVRAILSELKK